MSIKICTWNIRGSNNVVKRKSVLNSLIKEKIQVTFLQETHLTDEEHKKYLREWVGQVHFSSYSTNKRGVIILLHRNLPFTVTASFQDTEGRIVLVKGVLFGEDVLLGNIYAPNAQDGAFFALLFSQLAEMDCPNMIIGGDFNCSLSPSLDRLPPQNSQSSNARAVLNIIKEFDLLDVWRHFNPLSKGYTFQSLPHSSASRIDYIFVSKCVLNLILLDHFAGPLMVSAIWE
uniref:exodeoxyribonuclease III n=1 Tax=Labrus bergylta TaxID=56723 RepID=A0A3Q3FF70_9LABR